MKHYYSDPMTRNLIVHDTESEEIRILEKIEKVRVFTVSEVKFGDFAGPNQGAAVDEYDDKGGYENSILRRQAVGAARTHKTAGARAKVVRHCRKCGGTHGPRGLCPGRSGTVAVAAPLEEPVAPAEVAADMRSDMPFGA